MKSLKIITIIIVVFINGFTGYSQKTISEGSLVYQLSVETGSKETNMADMLDSATTTVYIKGNLTRSDMVSGLGSESAIYNSRTASGVILKNYSKQKLMITLSKDDWDKKNKKYEGITYETTNDSAVIAGYNCKKVIAKLKDGISFIVYYSPDLKVANTEYDYSFKTLPGLAMRYEWQSGKTIFKYTLSKISLDIIPSSKFDIPKNGYNILSYEEAQKLNKR